MRLEFVQAVGFGFLSTDAFDEATKDKGSGGGHGDGNDDVLHREFSRSQDEAAKEFWYHDVELVAGGYLSTEAND